MRKYIKIPARIKNITIYINRDRSYSVKEIYTDRHGKKRVIYKSNETYKAFKESWGQAMRGETYPIEMLWDEFDKSE